MPQSPKVTASPVINRILTGHFREKAGYEVRRPTGTKDWLLICTLDGKGEFGCGPTAAGVDDRIITVPGDVVLIGPNTPHDYRISPKASRWELLWAHFHPRPEWHSWMNWPVVSKMTHGVMRQSIPNTAERRTVEGALCKMNDLALGSHRLSKSMAMNALEEALLWCAKGVLRPDDHDPRVEQAEDYLCQHLRDNVTLGELAEVVGLSVSRLSHLFKQQSGVTPQRYYETQRLERARQLLELTNLPIKAIAAEIGFANPFYFTLRYTRHAGMSPRAYRRRVGGEFGRSSNSQSEVAER